MLTRRGSRSHRGSMTLEALTAIGVLSLILGSFAVAYVYEQKACRISYLRAAAMEIVDGEMELLAAGEWKAYKAGPQEYPVSSEAAKNLSGGRFLLIVEGKRLRLEWTPPQGHEAARVVREVALP